jgi:hypothetical protein
LAEAATENRHALRTRRAVTKVCRASSLDKLLGKIGASTKMDLRQIIDKIDDSQLFVPAFQREYVWKRADAKALSSYVKEHFP